MATQVTNYKCPSCTGPLHFEPSVGKLQCDYCESLYEVAEIEAIYAEKDEKAADAMAEAEKKANERARDEAENGWDMSGLNENWSYEAEGMKAYSCPSCGAELIFDKTTAATACPYCDNPTIVPGQLGGTLKPDYIIPFKLKKEDAIKALQEHYKGRPLLPKVFKDQNHLEEIKGVYVPFWLFDGVSEGDVEFEATNSRTYKSGDYEITETDHYNVYRQGSVAFEKIPVDGSSKMPDSYMDSLEPFAYEEMVEFSTAYLPGYMADKYDVTAEVCGAKADLRAESTAADCMRESVVGYEFVIEKSRNIKLKRGAVKYALLPVWILNTKWQDENYMFAMNGQTGKFVGVLPVDKKKKKTIAASVFLGSFVVIMGFMFAFGGLTTLLWG